MIGYGFSGATRDGAPSNVEALRGALSLFVGARLRGRRGAFYGITMLYRRDPRPFREDLSRLFALRNSTRDHK